VISLFAAIVFGAPGPEHRIVYHDATVRAEIRYRLAGQPAYRGDAAPGPSILRGRLIVTASGKRRTYDLTRLFPTHEVPIFLAESAAYSCGATAPIVHKSHYVALEAIVGAKGCAPIVTIVDLADGRVAEDVAFDPAWRHRYDAQPEAFDGAPAMVTNVETISLDFQMGAKSPVTAWPINIVRAKDRAGRETLVSFDARDIVSSSSTAATIPGRLPSVGQPIMLGTIDNRSGLVLQDFAGQPVLHLSDSDNAKYAAVQTPTPPNLASIAKRNAFFSLSMQEAQDGHFSAAVRSYGKMLALETDSSLYAGEAAALARCRALEPRIRAHVLTEAAAAASFPNDCREPK
jgi:hypothetical protein